LRAAVSIMEETRVEVLGPCMLKLSPDAPRGYKQRKHQDLLGEGTPSSRVISKLEGKRVVFMGVEPSVLGATQIQKQKGNFVVQADAIICGSLFAAITAARAEFLYVNARKEELLTLTNYCLTGFSFDNFHELVYRPADEVKLRNRQGFFPGIRLPHSIPGVEINDHAGPFLWYSILKDRSYSLPHSQKSELQENHGGRLMAGENYSGWGIYAGKGGGMSVAASAEGISLRPFEITHDSWTNVGGLLKGSGFKPGVACVGLEMCGCGCTGYQYNGECTVQTRPMVYYDALKKNRTSQWDSSFDLVCAPEAIEKVHVTGGTFSAIFGFPKGMFAVKTQGELFQMVQTQVPKVRNKKPVNPQFPISRPFAVIQVEEEISFVLPVDHPKKGKHKQKIYKRKK